MQEITKKIGCANEDSKKKERHIVTWSQQEDNILREQITIHGTDNWSIIASKFKDKTTRQCRRRWYTYLNSDFKKGGWSPEEDMLLCEAQKIFGNRWTEIAKVVSGRTDNAVKNRFSTLCKKRAKYEALAKENNNPYMNQNNKRVLFQNGFNADGTRENTELIKRARRSHIPDLAESHNIANRSHRESGTTMNPRFRPPFTVLVQNLPSVNGLPASHCDMKEVSNNAQNNKTQGMFLRKDDPKITALMQQAELLSSLALKVNTEDTEQSLEDAWKVLQDFLNRSKENDILRYTISDIDFQFEDFKDLIEDLRSTNEESHLSWRQPDLYEDSPASSEYSTGATLIPHPACDKPDQIQAEVDALHQDIVAELQSIHIGEQHCLGQQNKGSANTNEVVLFPSGGEDTNNTGAVSVSSSTAFSSPLEVTPLFRSLAAGIPSPKFSESERNFLLRTLGIESPSPNPSTNSVQPPPCKRALLQSL
ncbi:transcription factor MYB124-like isoform X2 [Mangifera indica]|uniref:transcription factor MYB124-like isoform X2 n=1 Tax=Mangifera indica TaxID=29780 RepID=UPI001CFC2C1F|nr:transcription factor MYB124-like isoform X2 [Mangifera indica]